MEKKEIKILFVSRGNIRSVMAQYMLRAMVRSLNKEGDFMIESASTSSEEVGSLIHDSARKVLEEQHIEIGNYVVRKMTWDDYDQFDYLIGMDDENLDDMKYICGADPDEKIRKLLEDRDIEDPWYSERYKEAFNDIQEGLGAFLNELITKDAVGGRI